MNSFGPGEKESPESAFDRRIVSRLRNLGDAQRAPDYLRERVLANLASEPAGPRRRAWRFRWDLIAAAGGGALVSAAAAAVLWFAASPQSIQNAESISWVDVAMSQTISPPTIQTDRPASLQSWFVSQAGYSVDIPDIPEATLLGGRLTDVQGIIAVAVDYQIDGVDLTYLMVPDRDMISSILQRREDMAMSSAPGYQIIMWNQGGGTRALVAAIPEDQLFQIADHCRRTMI